MVGSLGHMHFANQGIGEQASVVETCMYVHGKFPRQGSGPAEEVICLAVVPIARLCNRNMLFFLMCLI